MQTSCEEENRDKRHQTINWQIQKSLWLDEVGPVYIPKEWRRKNKRNYSTVMVFIALFGAIAMSYYYYFM